MNVENRIKLLNAEKAKILGFGRSHLRGVGLSRKLFADVEKRCRRVRKDFASRQTFLFWLWDCVKERCYELQKRGHYGFRVFDEGALEFLDQLLIKRECDSPDVLVERIRQTLPMLPEKARAVLMLLYRDDLPCRQIAASIGESEQEVYHLLQHSLILLSEAAGTGSEGGFEEQEDESFWTLALRYVDGTASEKFVADLNSEIHVNRSRTREYNDLRLVDGAMIEFGSVGEWPICSLLNEAEVSGEEKSQRDTSGSTSAKTKSETSGEDEISKETRVPLFVSILALITVGWGHLLNLVEFVFHPRARKRRMNESGSQIGEFPVAQPVLAHENLDKTTRTGVHVDRPGKFSSRKRKFPKPAKRITAVAAVVLLVGVLAGVAWKRFDRSILTNLNLGQSPKVLRSVGVVFADGSTLEGQNLSYGKYALSAGTFSFITNDHVSVIVEAPAAFKFDASGKFYLDEGKAVISTPAIAERGIQVITGKFHFVSDECEAGFSCDGEICDLVLFTGHGQLLESDEKLAPGTGLRFFQVGSPEALTSREEAYRLPPVGAPGWGI